MGNFWDDFGDGFKKPFVWGYDQANKRLNQVDKLADGAEKGAENLLNLVGGNSNLLVYAAIAVVGVIVVTTVLPKLIDKAV